MKIEDERLPKILAQQVIRDKCFWFREWKVVCDRVNLNINLSLENVISWREFFQIILSVLQKFHRNKFIGEARAGRFHALYRTLDFELSDKKYIGKDTQMWVMRWIFRARGELIHLNYKPWVANGNYICSMCNLKEAEDVFHFIARCPCLKEWRKKWFGVVEQSREEFTMYMNGKDWKKLASYYREAWNYRHVLIQEFNW